jgi:hypothetical protein
MDSEIEYLLNAIEEIDEKISRILNRLAIMDMRIENLEKRPDEDESPSR